jgi:transposase-like protein
MFTNLRELIQSMPTEEMCREYLAQQRWQGKPICPYCGSGRVYNIEKNKRYKCGNSECYKKFSVTVGTVMEASNVPLVKWFTAFYLTSAHKKGISSYQLGKDIGVSQKAAWFMLHRIREAMRVKTNEKLDNIVEVDETFVGGKVKNMSKSRRARLRTEQNGTIQNKVMVVGMVERGGNLKLIACGKTSGSHVVKPLVEQNVDTDAVLVTDASANYEGLINQYAGHEIINHSNDEYFRDGSIHTNTIEGAFGMLKRSIIGIYHQVTPKHLSRYCDETMFRYNLRKINDPQRFTFTLQNVEGRLKYKNLTAKDQSGITIETIPCPVPGKKTNPVYQIKNGKIIAEFPTVKAAAKYLGLSKRGIFKVLAGEKRTTGGFQWKYA